MGSFLLGCMNILLQESEEQWKQGGCWCRGRTPEGSKGTGYSPTSLWPVTRVHFHSEQQLLNLPLPKCSLSSLPSAKESDSNECQLWSTLSQPCSLPMHHPAAAPDYQIYSFITSGHKEVFYYLQREIAACFPQLFSEQLDHEETSPARASH